MIAERIGPMRLSPRSLAYVTASLFTACSLVEIANAISGGSLWLHLAPMSSAIALVEVAMWLVGSYCLATRSSWGWFPPALAALAALAHGSVLMVAENRLPSLLFVGTGAVGLWAVRRLVLPFEGAAPWFVRREAQAVRASSTAARTATPAST
jgi:hypothetical protein